MKRLLFLLPVLYIGLYFFHNAGWGLRAGFTHDDLMNMYRSMETSYKVLVGDCVVFWRPSLVYRPFGALVYKVSLDLFGLDLTGLSVLRYLALCLNLVLVYFLARRLTGSRETGALAALLLAYHPAFSALYYDSGTLYDVFCFSFYFAAFAYYVRIRQSGRFPGPLQLLVFCLLFVLGLDSKEMAVTLPVLLGFYELLYHPPQSAAPKSLAAWLRNAAPVPLGSACMSLAYSLGRVLAKDGLASVGGYKPVFSLAEYVKQTGHYLAEVLDKPDTALAAVTTVLFLMFLLAATLVLRSRALALSALLFTVGILPLAFVPWRGLGAVSIPVVGLAIFGSALLVVLKDRLTRHLAGKIALFALVAAALLKVYPDTSSQYDAWRRQEYEPIRAMMTQMRQLHPTLKKTDRILIVEDSFGEFNWASLFITRLVYREPALIVDRLASMEHKPTAEQVAKYDVRLSFENGKLRDVSPSEVPATR